MDRRNRLGGPVRGADLDRGTGRRRRSGLVAPPLAITVLKIAAVAVAVVVLLLVCNTDRGELVPAEGCPLRGAGDRRLPGACTPSSSAAPGSVGTCTPSAATPRPPGGAGSAWVGTGCGPSRSSGFTAGAAGIVYASRLGSISNNIDGGQLVLYAVAAAVIGGTSLFGGRGKMVHALLGGLVIATIYNGMGLLGLAASYQYMVTALVLLAAVTIDALARRGRAAA